MDTLTKSLATAALLGLPFLPADAAAQMAQRVSLQISAVQSVPFGGDLLDLEPGPGGEVQLRLSFGAFSLGFGGNTFEHDVRDTRRILEVYGTFLEPRYVVAVGGDVAALYLSGRAAVTRNRMTIVNDPFGTGGSSRGSTLNGGGGVLVRLGSRVNLDIGATVGKVDLGELTLDGGEFVDVGSGNNVIIRVGFAIGLGG